MEFDLLIESSVKLICEQHHRQTTPGAPRSPIALGPASELRAFPVDSAPISDLLFLVLIFMEA